VRQAMQEQSDEIQEPLSPMEAKGLRQQLTQAHAELATIGKLAQAKQMCMHTCAYCDYQYPLESTLAEHIKSCPKHPLSSALTELTQIRAELASVCTTRDALARECNQLEDDREYNASLVMERDRTIAHVRQELKDLQGANREYRRQLTALARTQEENTALRLALKGANELSREWQTELAQARAELAVVDEMLGKFHRPGTEDHGVYTMRAELDHMVVARADAEFAAHTERQLRREVELTERIYKDALDDVTQALHTEHEARQEAEKHAKNAKTRISHLSQVLNTESQSRREAEQRHKAALAQIHENNEYSNRILRETNDKLAETLTQIRAKMTTATAKIASCREATEWLWGFWDSNSLRAIPGLEDDIREAWNGLLAATDIEAAAKLLDRLKKLDATEAALAGCGISGIYDDFNDDDFNDLLPDAIEQMAQYIDELTQEDRRRTGQVKMLQTERQLRREAERRCEAMAEMARDRGQRAEVLVNEETARLLEQLAGITVSEHHTDTYWSYRLAALNLATQIREALDDNKT